ncbi:MAG: cation:proton antiporter, partial [Burkholderiaceae bacterium]|nr:cation:proton antiporter [Burkholderiaceae bacterium]
MIDLGILGLNPITLQLPAELGWPFALALAWVVGEFGTRWTKLPRISLYGLVGFALANAQIGFLSNLDNDTVLLLANIAFGLILFEFGYRINLQWLRTNPWIGVNGVMDAIISFLAIYWVAQWFGVSTLAALLMAALSMASSPAGVLRVINERRSSGQVSERILHLTAINCVLSVFTFKVILVLWVSHTSGNVIQATSSTLLVLAASTAFGLAFGYVLPVILRRLGNLAQDSTVAFACAVILLVALTHSLKLSPILASLTFGLVARHRRVTLNRTQRNFGALGDLLTVLLFVFAASTLEWFRVLAGIGLGAILVSVRLLSKTLV